MSVLLIVWLKCTLAASHAASPGELRWVCRRLRQTDRRTDGHQTVTLRFPLDAASVINPARQWFRCSRLNLSDRSNTEDSLVDKSNEITGTSAKSTGDFIWFFWPHIHGTHKHRRENNWQDEKSFFGPDACTLCCKGTVHRKPRPKFETVN